jgi:hypothetical protein
MVLCFFWVFCTSLPNQVEQHGSNLNSMFVIISKLIFFVDGVLTQNFNTMDLVKFLEKNENLHIWIIVVTLMATSCKIMSKKK